MTEQITLYCPACIRFTINRVKRVSLQNITAIEAQIGVEKIWQYFEQNCDKRQCVVVPKTAVSKVRENKSSKKN